MKKITGFAANTIFRSKLLAPMKVYGSGSFAHFTFYSVSLSNFSKKADNTSTSKKEQQRTKDKEEKDKINKEFENVSKEDLVKSFQDKIGDVIKKEEEELGKIMSIRISPKIFEHIQVLLKHEKSTVGQLATISMKAANIVSIAPFDSTHKDLIIKGLQTTKLDLQINTEGQNITVIVGPIPKDLKAELLAKVKKIEANMREEVRKVKHNATAEIKKIEKILGKDQSKLIDKNITDSIDKEVKKVEKAIKNKIDELAK